MRKLNEKKLPAAHIVICLYMSRHLSNEHEGNPVPAIPLKQSTTFHFNKQFETIAFWPMKLQKIKNILKPIR